MAERGITLPPFNANDPDVDPTVGVATIVQTAGELAAGVIGLLRVDNRGTMALLRQIVEVEYLASAFADGDDAAAEWLRAYASARRDFWTPAKLRKRSGDPADW